jgi:xylan 1,4-beta-xylosidase
LLHQLGQQRIANNSDDVIVTRDRSGNLVIAVWNLVDPGVHGEAKTMALKFQGVSPGAEVMLQSVDDEHGNVLPKYKAMGSPLDPTPAQVEQLNRQTALGPARHMELNQGRLSLRLEPNALVLLTVQAQRGGKD